MHLKKFLACVFVAAGVAASALAFTASNPFAGSWSGTYTGANGGGTLDTQISQAGVLTGILINQDNVQFAMRGHVDNQGRMNAVAIAAPDIIVPFGGTFELSGGNLVGTTFIRGTDVTFESEQAPVLMPALSGAAAR